MKIAERHRLRPEPAGESGEHWLKRELYGLVRTDPRIFEFLQDGSLDGIWYWDIEGGREEWLSPRFKELFGYADHEMADTVDWWQANIHPDDLALALENFERHKADPDHPYDQIVRYRHRDGSTVWVRCRGLMIRDEAGQPIRMLGAHTDVTALKRAEQALARANAQKDRFFSILAHDLKSPFNALLGLTEILAEDVHCCLPPEKARDYAQAAHSAAMEAYRLLEDLLEWSRLQFGRLEVDPVPLDLAALAGETVARYGVLANAKSVAIEADFDRPILALADADMLRTVLRNLIANAVKFTPSGGRVTLARASAADGRAALVVADTGVGMSQEQLAGLFQLDAMGSRQGTAGEQGTGLGLLISHEMLARQNGEMAVASAPGEGTRVTITLPEALPA